MQCSNSLDDAINMFSFHCTSHEWCNPVSLWKHFPTSEEEQEEREREQENQSVKTKKAPLREGPNQCKCWIISKVPFNCLPALHSKTCKHMSLISCLLCMTGYRPRSSEIICLVACVRLSVSDPPTLELVDLRPWFLAWWLTLTLARLWL